MNDWHLDNRVTPVSLLEHHLLEWLSSFSQVFVLGRPDSLLTFKLPVSDR